MTIVWNLIKAFLVGGALCMIGEILLLKTKLLIWQSRPKEENPPGL